MSLLNTGFLSLPEEEHGLLRLSLRASEQAEQEKEKVKEKPQPSQDAKHIPEYLKLISSEDAASQVKAAQWFRIVLSSENPPTDEAVHAGAVQKLARLLLKDENPNAQIEAGWALTILASGASAHTKIVVKSGVIASFVQLLSSPSAEVQTQAMKGLSAIAEDSTDFRDTVLQQGALAPILALINSKPASKVMASATRCLLNFCRGTPAARLLQIRDAIPVLSQIIQTCTDEDVLTEACWALSHFSDGPCDRIETLCQHQVEKRLVELLSHDLPAVQAAALRTIGNMAAGDDYITQKTVQAGLPAAIAPLLGHERQIIHLQAIWTISNITAGDKQQIQTVIDAGIIPPLVKFMENEKPEFQREAACAVSNATTEASEEQMEYLVQQGCIQLFCKLLCTSQDNKTLYVSLEALHNFLDMGVKRALEQGKEINEYSELVDKLGGTAKIEELAEHTNYEISTKCMDILEDHFCSEGEESREPLDLVYEPPPLSGSWSAKHKFDSNFKF